MNRAKGERADERPRTTRTCIGCGRRDDAGAMARLTAVGDRLACARVLGRGRGAPGRGAHVHPRPGCLAKAPRGLARALRRPVRGVDAGGLAAAVAEASEAAMRGLLRGAARRGVARAGLDTNAALVVVATHGPVAAALGDADRAALAALVPAGRAVAWATKSELGALLGDEESAFCAVHDRNVAAQLIRLRAAADAGTATARSTREGAECSRCPEGR